MSLKRSSFSFPSFLSLQVDESSETRDVSERTSSKVTSTHRMIKRRFRCRAENRSLSEELKSTRRAADAARVELEEKMAEAVTEVTLLHHTLRGLTDELHASLPHQVAADAPEPPGPDGSHDV